MKLVLKGSGGSFNKKDNCSLNHIFTSKQQNKVRLEVFRRTEVSSNFYGKETN